MFETQLKLYVISYINGTLMSEVTPVTIQYIRPLWHGHTSLFIGH